MTNQFDSGGGTQNIAQGKNAIGKQENVTQEVSGHGNIFSGSGNVYYKSIPPETLIELAGKLAVTDSALASFFRIMEQQQVPLGDLDSKLREIATQYKELRARLENVQSADPEVQRLKAEAKQAIEAGDYAKAEELLNQAEARDVQDIEHLEDAAKQRRISAAASNVDNANLQEVQLRYAKAAAYWQKAAALLPDDKQQERSLYLHSAGYDLHRIASYKEALPLYEQSLRISREIGDKAGEGVTLNNISQIYDAQGDYDAALKHLEQSLRIMQEIGDKAGEGVARNNISGIHSAQGDYDAALKYLEQSLSIRREIGDKAGEGTTLNNISQIHHAKGNYAAALKYLKQSLHIRQKIGDKAGEAVARNNISQIYDARGDYAAALKYLKQSLRIRQEIGDKAGEAVTSWNIGLTYKEQGELSKAEPYMNRAAQLAEEIGHPSREEYRAALEDIRAQLRGR